MVFIAQSIAGCEVGEPVMLQPKKCSLR